LLNLRQANQKDGGKAVTELPIVMGLANETGFPHRGKVDFVDSRVDAKTGSIVARAIFANPRAKDGSPLMMPGMAVRLRLTVGEPYEALLVTDRALMVERGSKHVYVLEDEKKVALRRVTIGQLQADGLRVIIDGLKKNDSVVVGGHSLIRPGAVIVPKRIEMPAVK
jgi:RND family efflux transporter MFP subunit